jgi:hypothetical protein
VQTLGTGPELAAPTPAGPTPAPPRAVLDRVPDPAPGEQQVPLEGLSVAGLVARHIDWSGETGRLVATGEGPWTDTTAVFAIDPDGRPTGPVETTSSVRMAGAPVATVRAVLAWDGTTPLPRPAVTADGPVLRITAPGATVDVRPGLVTRDGEAGTEIALPPAIRDLVAEGVRGFSPDLLETPPPAPIATPETTQPAPAGSPPEQVPAVTESSPQPPEAAEPETAAEMPVEDITPAREVPVEETPVELLMPPAPTQPGPAQTARIGDVSGVAHTAAGRAADLPPAATTVADAQAAVGTPQAEADARAGADLAAALEQRPTPSPEILALCDRIRTAIRERRPVDEKDLTKADIQGAARQAGQSLDTAVRTDTTRVQGSYEPLAQTPTGTATQGTPAPQPEPRVGDPGIAADRAAPDPIPAANLSLDADRDRVETMAGQSRIERHSTEPLQQIPPYSEVRTARDELAGVAETGPPDVAAQQAQAIASAQADMAGLQRQALAALNADRGGTVRGVAGGQTAMVGQETRTRESVSQQAQAIFTDAQTRVRQLLEPLSRTAMARWDAEVARLSREFRDHLDTVQHWIDERHKGASGWAVAVWDAVTGLPRWVTQQYDDAEKRFGDGVCEVLASISTDVNAVIATAEAIIAGARTKTTDLFANLPAELREWAAGERARFAAQLDGLAAQARDARTSFVTEISDRAVSSVAEIQAQVEELRKKAGGLVGRIRAAIDEFVKDPTRAIINGLLTLVGIPPESFWALVMRIGQVVDQIADDPETFGNNLAEALRLGFQGFFDRFGQHLMAGFWQWLFSRCKQVGVTLPTDSSLGGIIKFILSIMGITWPNIRKILVRHVGAKNVEIIEKVWELVSLLIERGPDGILEMLKEKLDPETIVNAVVEAAIQFTIEALVEKVALRLLAMLNPAGAVLQAIQLIYKVLKWVFENAARIFTLVETVVNMCAEIMAGKLGHVAEMVEKALAWLLPMVIDLLAELIGLGDLPDKVAEMIGRLQAVVLPIVERVIVELVTRGRALLASLGLGGKDDKKHGGDDELGTTVRFTAGNESHRVFIAETGAHVMIASIPAPVASKIAQWREQVEKMTDPGDKKEATGLLDELQPLIATADEEVATIGPAMKAAAHDDKPEKEEPDDDKLEDDERSIAKILDRLYTLLVPDIDKIIEQFSPQLPGFANDKVTSLTGIWASWLEAIQVGPVGTRRPLVEKGADALTGLTGAVGESVYNDHGNLRALAGYFILTTHKREGDTDAFYAFVFATRRPSPPHEVRPKFVKAVGDAAVGQIKAYVIDKLPSMTMSPEERVKIADAVGKATFTASSDAGRFNGLTTREPDHTFFMPQNLTPKGKSVVYTTVTGQTFTVELDENDLPKKVTGDNLTIFVGRGVTQNSPYYVENQGFNRAHVIANRLGGSGYGAAHNLVTTSAEYNQGPMKKAEDNLVEYVDKNAGDVEHRVPAGPTPMAAVVTFSLEVNLTYVDPIDRLVKAKIAKDEQLPDHDPKIEEEILKKLKDAGISRKLKRVEQTRYDLDNLKIANESTEGTDEEAGEDIWLLSKFGA